MKPHFKVSQRGFTLIEIMLVTGMMLLMLGWGVPNMMRALEKHGIAKASMDVMDG
ncbi:MAG: type II secretion system protein, partial [Verrucomicrobia bacterium]|nr:type II secretion system protein [Verrucomicrobiota bacterium]